MGSVGLLGSSTNPAKKLLRLDAAMVVTTAGQFAKLLPALEEPGSTLMRELRSTLQTIVIDELDMVLDPRTSVRRYAATSRAQRQRLLERLPVCRVLRHLTPRCVALSPLRPFLLIT